MLEKEREFFKKNLPELLAKSNGRIVLIKGEELIGIYNTPEEALSEGARRFGLQSFLVRTIAEKQEDISIPALSLGILNANSAQPA
jgi:hypothetical protein